MMGDNNSWVKVYRKMLSNPMWQHDINAAHLFMTLLMLVDRKSGKWSGGRLQLEAFSGIKNSTIFKCLKRLEKAKMVTLSSNNHFTVICICNWSKYQDDGNSSGNSHVTTSEQPRNTLTRKRRRREVIDTNVSIVKKENGKPEINEIFGYWEKTIGYPIQSKVQMNRNAANNLLKKYSIAQMQQLINGVNQAHGTEFAPQISDFIQLQSKLNELFRWGKKKGLTHDTAIID